MLHFDLGRLARLVCQHRPVNHPQHLTTGTSPHHDRHYLRSPLSKAPAVILGTAAFLIPAVGATTDLVLQDTLKSGAWALTAFLAALAVLADRLRALPSSASLTWQPVLAVPAGLALWALASAQLSAGTNQWLGTTEAARWLVVLVLAWVALNIRPPRAAHLLATAIWFGAVVASMWAILQFWLGLDLFAQGPAHPASTFANRNFYAEYAVCSLPFAGPVLLAIAHRRAALLAAAALTGLIAVGIMATGMRTALWLLWVLLPAGAWLLWRPMRERAGRVGALAAAGCFLATVASLGSLPTGDDLLRADGRGITAMERALHRSSQTSMSDPSLGLRRVMWGATIGMIAQHPLTGVGAGGWERQVPLHLPAGHELELDYHAHNEYLQLAAEYGLPAAALALGALAMFYGQALRSLLGRRVADEQDQREGASTQRIPACIGAAAAASLLCVAAVSFMGFALHMAATTALFALSLGLLARWCSPRPVTAQPRRVAGWMQVGAALSAAGLLASVIVSVQALRAEHALTLAHKHAFKGAALAQAGAERSQVDESNSLAFELAAQGVSINPHYRRLIPQIGEDLARAGAHAEAIALWELMLQSRPHVAVILANTARSYLALGQHETAWDYLERATAVSQQAPAVLALQVTLLASSGQRAQALQAVRAALAAGYTNVDLLSNGLVLASLAGDAATAAECRSRLALAGDGALAGALLQLGNFWAQEHGDVQRSQAAWLEAMQAAPTAIQQAALVQLLVGARSPKV